MQAECQAKTMDVEQQAATAAMVNMDKDGITASMELTKQAAAANTAAAGSLAAVMLAMFALAL